MVLIESLQSSLIGLPQQVSSLFGVLPPAQNLGPGVQLQYVLEDLLLTQEIEELWGDYE